MHRIGKTVILKQKRSQPSAFRIGKARILQTYHTQKQDKKTNIYNFRVTALPHTANVSIYESVYRMFFGKIKDFMNHIIANKNYYLCKMALYSQKKDGQDTQSLPVH